VSLWETLLNAAVGPGTRLPDTGCGAGGASVLAAGRGPWSAGLMPRKRCSPTPARTRRRLPARLSGSVTLYRCDVRGRPRCRRAALCGRPLATLRELRRVCVPRGRVVIALCAGQGVCLPRGRIVGGCYRYARPSWVRWRPMRRRQAPSRPVNRFRYKTLAREWERNTRGIRRVGAWERRRGDIGMPGRRGRRVAPSHSWFREDTMAGDLAACSGR